MMFFLQLTLSCLGKLVCWKIASSKDYRLFDSHHYKRHSRSGTQFVAMCCSCNKPCSNQDQVSRMFHPFTKRWSFHPCSVVSKKNIVWDGYEGYDRSWNGKIYVLLVERPYVTVILSLIFRFSSIVVHIRYRNPAVVGSADVLQCFLYKALFIFFSNPTEWNQFGIGGVFSVKKDNANTKRWNLVYF